MLRKPSHLNVNPLIQLYDAVFSRRSTARGVQHFLNLMWRHADQLMEVLKEAEKLGQLKYENVPQHPSVSFAIGKIIGSVEKLKQDIRVDKKHLSDGDGPT